MSTASKSRLSLGALLLAPVLFLSPAQAQQVERAPAAPVQASAKAQELHQRALAIEAEIHERTAVPARFRRAAQLHAQSAALRTADDPVAEECLRSAARLLGTIDPVQAATYLEMVAERASARGDVLAAAHAYVDAAWVTQNNRGSQSPQVEAARAHVARAELLAHSPLLSASERSALLRRIQRSQPQIAAVSPQ